MTPQAALQRVIEHREIFHDEMVALMRQIKVKGLAHITGGGLVENIPRALPEGVTAVLQKSAWPMPPLFKWLQQHGGVAESEMHRVFNCGIGMTVVVSAADAAAAQSLLEARGETVYVLGEIAARPAGATAVEMLR